MHAAKMMKYVKREVMCRWSHVLETRPSGHKHSLSSQKMKLESKNGQLCVGSPGFCFIEDFRDFLADIREL